MNLNGGEELMPSRRATQPDMGRTAKALAQFLAANPRWTFTRIRRCLRNRYWSEGVNYGEAAWMWIKFLAMYADDPLDAKRRPKIGLGDGVEKWWASQRVKDEG